MLNASVNGFSDYFEDEQVKAHGLVAWVEHQSTGCIPMPKVPALPDFKEGTPKARSPHIGQDSREVLSRLGYGADEIEALIIDGIVKVYGT